MSFQPQVNQEIAIENQPYRVAAHPAAPALPYGQEGRQAVVYQLAAGSERRALKVFKSRFQVPALVTLADRLGAFAGLPGLQVCRRTVLTPQRHAVLLRQSPDLLYAVLMPWIPGPTWMEVLLQGTAFTPEQSLHLARTLAEVLAGMEQRGVAHCDLSGPNVILPALDGAALRNPPCAIQLVDVEQFYGPGLDRPAALPSGSAGYAHAAAAQGLATPDADRFAGAVLLAEMLGWCDPRVCSAAWGESYFDPAEMQRPGERLQTLDAVLRERWGAPVARLFEQAWSSEALADCPPFGAWLLALPDSVPAPAKASAPQPATAEAAQAPAMPEAVQVLLSLGGDFAAQGNAASARDTYRRALALLPAGSGTAQEVALMIRDLEAPAGGAVPPAPARPPPRPSTRPDVPGEMLITEPDHDAWDPLPPTQPTQAQPAYSRYSVPTGPVKTALRPGFLRWWFIGATLSWSLAILVRTLFSPYYLIGLSLLLLVGTAIGTVQWLVLRAYIPGLRFWILAMAGGWIIGTFLANLVLPGFRYSSFYYFYSFGSQLLTDSVAGLLIGALTGWLQWFTIRGKLDRAGLWIPWAILASVVAWSGVGVFGGNLIGAALGGLLYGAVTTLGFRVMLGKR